MQLYAPALTIPPKLQNFFVPAARRAATIYRRKKTTNALRDSGPACVLEREAMKALQAVRGTRDLLPPETELWNQVESVARSVFARYGFGEIRTPIFEDVQLFARGVGEETDIFSKEMYTWEDRARAQSEKSQSLTLRPENTAGVLRSYI